jgi:hypothetical protein
MAASKGPGESAQQPAHGESHPEPQSLTGLPGAAPSQPSNRLPLPLSQTPVMGGLFQLSKCRNCMSWTHSQLQSSWTILQQKGLLIHQWTRTYWRPHKVSPVAHRKEENTPLWLLSLKFILENFILGKKFNVTRSLWMGSGRITPDSRFQTAPMFSSQHLGNFSWMETWLWYPFYPDPHAGTETLLVKQELGSLGKGRKASWSTVNDGLQSQLSPQITEDIQIQGSLSILSCHVGMGQVQRWELGLLQAQWGGWAENVRDVCLQIGVTRSVSSISTTGIINIILAKPTWIQEPSNSLVQWDSRAVS